MSKGFVFSLGGIIVLSIAFLFLYIFLLSPQKVAYVDSNKILNNYEGMQDARDAFQKKTAAWKANVDTLTNEVQLQIMELERAGSGMTSMERKLSQELIQSKQEKLMHYQEALNTQAQQEDTRMTEEVISQVNGYLKRYGAEHGYRIIFAATSYGNIAYADEGLDITENVLEGLNKEYGR